MAQDTKDERIAKLLLKTSTPRPEIRDLVDGLLRATGVYDQETNFQYCAAPISEGETEACVLALGHDGDCMPYRATPLPPHEQEIVDFLHAAETISSCANKIEAMASRYSLLTTSATQIVEDMRKQAHEYIAEARQRISSLDGEDEEDYMDTSLAVEAMVNNGNQPMIPWEDVKKELGL